MFNIRGTLRGALSVKRGVSMISNNTRNNIRMASSSCCAGASNGLTAFNAISSERYGFNKKIHDDNSVMMFIVIEIITLIEVSLE